MTARALARVRKGWWPVALASLAAALAWLIAHQVLGHRQPFFAPIAAAISLSTSEIQRSRRILQLVGGVVLGIAIGELLVALIGTGTVAIGVIVFVTMTAALLTGGGFIGEGMMFANQAAASAILVVTLHRAGTGSERIVDALIGGAVAFVLGVLLFPAEPLSLIGGAERGLLRSLASTLEAAASLAAGPDSPRRWDRPQPAGPSPLDAWLLSTSEEIHQRLAALVRARSTARLSVRIAPRRWHLRKAIDAEVSRTANLALLANASLGVVRAVVNELELQASVPGNLRQEVEALACAIEDLSSAPQPWSAEVTGAARMAAEFALSARIGGTEGTMVLDLILRRAASDLLLVIDPSAGRG